MERFLRTQQLLGDSGFRRLQSSRVVVIGLGAVGGYAVEGLARAGVGSLRLFDFDTIQPSNINRQILALESTLYQPKAKVAAERVRAINPNCLVEAQEVFADQETLATILDPVPDLVIDAIDSLNPKIQLLSEVYKRGIPLLSSMGAALRTDPGKIAVGDIAESRGCPLAKRVRKRLRRVGIETGIRCVFSTEKVTFTYTPPVSDPNVPPANIYENRGRKRVILGSLPTLTGIFGLILANEAILYLSGGSEEGDNMSTTTPH